MSNVFEGDRIISLVDSPSGVEFVKAGDLGTIVKSKNRLIKVTWDCDGSCSEWYVREKELKLAEGTEDEEVNYTEEELIEFIGTNGSV